MAEEDLDLDVEGEEAGGASKGGGLKIIIIAAVGVILLSSVIFAILYFTGVVGGGSDNTAAAGKATPAATASQAGAAQPSPSKSSGPLIYQPMEPPFVVNFGPDSEVRLMQITLQVADRDPAVIENVKNNSPAIRNALVLLFSGQDPHVLNSRAGKEQLRQEALDETRRVLKEMTGNGKLENLFFTSFLMQ